MNKKQEPGECVFISTFAISDVQWWLAEAYYEPNFSTEEHIMFSLGVTLFPLSPFLFWGVLHNHYCEILDPGVLLPVRQVGGGKE